MDKDIVSTRVEILFFTLYFIMYRLLKDRDKILDVLNIVPLFNKHLIDVFECFSPYKLMINANDGKFSSDFSLEKEQKIGLYILNNETPE